MVDDSEELRRTRAWRETLFACAYFAVFVGYLFVYQESELLHWLSLVILPLLGVAVAGRHASVRALLRSIGLDGATATRGLFLAAALAIGFQGLQLLNVRQRADLIGILHEPTGLVFPVLAFVVLVGTAATTEEVFFRGILQARFADALRSELAGLVVSMVAFIIFHVPYAYLSPSWPTAGHFAAALQAAAANSLVGGLPLAIVYWRSRRNLFATICLHACIDLIPATQLVHRLLAERP